MSSPTPTVPVSKVTTASIILVEPLQTPKPAIQLPAGTRLCLCMRGSRYWGRLYAGCSDSERGWLRATTPVIPWEPKVGDTLRYAPGDELVTVQELRARGIGWHRVLPVAGGEAHSAHDQELWHPDHPTGFWPSEQPPSTTTTAAAA